MKITVEMYAAAKRELSTSLGASEDLLHVHAGLLIFFVTALLLRRRMRSRLPIASVFLFALCNEVVDAFSPGSSGNRWEPLADIANTVVWPTLLFLLARRKGASGSPEKTA
jgi:hypothetical protein